MERRVAIAGSRDGYYPFFAKDATVTEISEARRIGPFTRAEVISLVWRIKKFRIVATMAATAEKEVYNEATEEYETVTTPFTREVDLICVSAYSSTLAERNGEVLDEDLVAYFLRPDLAQVYQYPADGLLSADEVARFSFFFSLADEVRKDHEVFPDLEVWKDPDGGHWIEGHQGASTRVDNVSSGWVVPTSDDTFTIEDFLYLRRGLDPVDQWRRGDPPGDEDVLYFTGKLVLGDWTVDLPMAAYPNGDSEVGRVVSVESATFAATVEEWRPYATTAGAPAWNTTTGAPANGGPGA